MKQFLTDWKELIKTGYKNHVCFIEEDLLKELKATCTGIGRLIYIIIFPIAGCLFALIYLIYKRFRKEEI